MLRKRERRESATLHGTQVVWDSNHAGFGRIPRTADRPAEHLIAVVFGRPNFIEVAFARLKMVDGAGCSFVYSHRIYSEKIGDQMSAWLKTNGAEVEKALMEWNPMPSAASLRVTAH